VSNIKAGLESFLHSSKTMISRQRNHAHRKSFSAYEKTLLKRGIAEAALLGEADYIRIMNQWKAVMGLK
jgi:hypothetical protein